LIEPLSWKRRIGGISGVFVDLPAGTYSDDTQLRLAVSRAIRADGMFDVEVFAKIELPIWQSYSLGAGKGSRAAAANLAKRDVNWFSNFFTYDGNRSYVDGGGNGAAMRIQPHVWRRAGTRDESYLDDVVKDAIVTHGNMRGVCGAVFHAYCLAFVFTNNEVPGPSAWLRFIGDFVKITEVVEKDFQLNRFWLNTWEHVSGKSLTTAIGEVVKECTEYVHKLQNIHWAEQGSYAEILEVLDGYSADWKGTGTNTALAAAALAWDSRNFNRKHPEHALLLAVNAVGSDTDTIATMVGALVGIVSELPPPWPIQDYEYIVLEALRMVGLAQRDFVTTYRYPDLIGWVPPSTQSDAVGKNGDQFFLKGFGKLQAVSKNWRAGEFVWQWFKLEFGQTILCKYRAEMKMQDALEWNILEENRQSRIRVISDKGNSRKSVDSLPLFLDDNREVLISPKNIGDDRLFAEKKSQATIEELTELVIKSNFDAVTIGNCLLMFAEETDGIERSIAFSAIVVKALAARQKKMAR
jgi:ADP-ribosylglycohydrolase